MPLTCVNHPAALAGAVLKHQIYYEMARATGWPCWPAAGGAHGLTQQFTFYAMPESPLSCDVPDLLLWLWWMLSARCWVHEWWRNRAGAHAERRIQSARQALSLRLAHFINSGYSTYMMGYLCTGQTEASSLATSFSMCCSKHGAAHCADAVINSLVSSPSQPA